MQEFVWPLNTTTYGYDQAGNLVSVQRPKAGENPAIEETLAYDATGLLTARTVGAATKHLAWDASTNLPLLLNDGEASYIYGPGGLPIEQINAKEEPTYLHHDQLGSTRLLTSSTGTTTAAQSYTPYGTQEAKTGTAATPLGYAGQYTDAETGLQYLRARFYDPTTGQFMSRDPLVALTRQPYSYGLDNPLEYVDPTGTFAQAGALVCAAGPEAAAGCALGGAGAAACAVSAACRAGAQAAAEGASDVLSKIGSLFGDDESIEETEERLFRERAEAEEKEEEEKICLEPPIDPRELNTEMGDPTQARDLAFGRINRYYESMQPGGSRGSGIGAIILSLIHAFWK